MMWGEMNDFGQVMCPAATTVADRRAAANPVTAHCSRPDVTAASINGPNVTAASAALAAATAILTGNEEGSVAGIAEAAAVLTAAANALPPESFVYLPLTVSNLNKH